MKKYRKCPALRPCSYFTLHFSSLDRLSTDRPKPADPAQAGRESQEHRARPVRVRQVLQVRHVPDRPGQDVPWPEWQTPKRRGRGWPKRQEACQQQQVRRLHGPWRGGGRGGGGGGHKLRGRCRPPQGHPLPHLRPLRRAVPRGLRRAQQHGGGKLAVPHLPPPDHGLVSGGQAVRGGDGGGLQGLQAPSRQKGAGKEEGQAERLLVILLWLLFHLLLLGGRVGEWRFHSRVQHFWSWWAVQAQGNLASLC